MNHPQGQLGGMQFCCQRQTPPGMMQGPTPRFGPILAPQRRSSQMDGYGHPETGGEFPGYQQPAVSQHFRPRPPVDADSPSYTHNHPSSNGSTANTQRIPTTNDLTQHGRENASLYENLSKEEVANKAFQAGRRQTSEYFQRFQQNRASGMGGGRWKSIQNLYSIFSER